MDLHLKQWRNQHESAQQHPAKIPKLLVEAHQQLSGVSALPSFVSEPNSKISSLSAFPDSTSATTRVPRMGSYFSLAQWQELELQAMIFSLLCYNQGTGAELPWIRSQDGVGGLTAKNGGAQGTWMAGQKYCERHLHRGRNRSRKPVELPTPSTSGGGGSAATDGGGDGGALGATTPISSLPMATVSLKSPFDLHFNHSFPGSKIENNGLFGSHSNANGDVRSDGRILRHFFDDYPRSAQEPDNGDSNSSRMNSATCLSISMPGNPSSDVSLKLSTGNEEDLSNRNGNVDIEQPQLNWEAGWVSTNPVASMGGPLAEALRSSTSSSPTSVLHQLPRSSVSESTSFISNST
ncbi:Growth-regulating factor 3 [Quillaja saponaria]|uniref:Growth-regulating factor n=1 Tax=Quillaja saponaria TaxID=32244 RepID=A0AAD7Q740_QUISA|nr:Growth-regulating factor 3 [Quillaja saponaria]